MKKLIILFALAISFSADAQYKPLSAKEAAQITYDALNLDLYYLTVQIRKAAVSGEYFVIITDSISPKNQQNLFDLGYKVFPIIDTKLRGFRIEWGPAKPVDPH